MRTYTRFATGDTRDLLRILADQSSSPTEYRGAMTSLGQRLAVGVAQLVPSIMQSTVFCIVCTVEDADFLARGLLEGLQAGGVEANRLKLVCFWNERVRRFTGDTYDSFNIAPIVKQYREEVDVRNAVLVVVKSIISGACVVKTNIATLIDRSLPKHVIVAAPVMLKGAEGRLASEFPSTAAERFEYITFAIDDEKGADDNVIPGIGGSVYQRLGVDDKTTYVPDIIKQRRQMLTHP